MGKGNHVLVLLLCSHWLWMRQENCPSLPEPGPALLGPSPSLTPAEVAGGDRDPCALLLVSPSGTSLQLSVQNEVQARESKAKLSSVPRAAPRENPEDSLPSALSTPLP